MDIEETRNAYERAIMPDEQTMKDHIEDLMIEKEQLLKQIRALTKEKAHLRKIVGMAFTQAGNGCITGCRTACMCTCGFEHYRYIVNEEQRTKDV